MKYLCYAMVGIFFVATLAGILISDRTVIVFSILGALYFLLCGKAWEKHKKMKRTQKPETIKEAMGKAQTKTTEKSSTKRSNIKNIEIRDEWISADVGKTGDLSCDIVCRSENGKYHFGSGTYCATEDSDDIDCIFLFTDEEMLYRKEFEEGIEAAMLLDDGTVLLLDDEQNLRVYDITGKQIVKNETGISADVVDMNEERIIVYGTDDNGDQYLESYICAEHSLIKNKIPDIEFIDKEGEEDIISGDEAEIEITATDIIVTYPNYKRIFFFSDGRPNKEKTLETKIIIAEGCEISRVNLNGYISPSGNYMNYGIFEVSGIKPTTGRKNKRTYEAKDEAGALRAAAEDGLQDAEVVRALEEEPPTERQKECLEGLGVTIPQGACKYDVSAMIGRILDSQDIVEEIAVSKTEEKQYVKPLESPSEELAIYADKMGLKFSKYISAGNLHGSIALRLEDRDKAAYFAYCVLCAHSGSEIGNLLESPNKEQIFEFADKTATDEALMRSINGREPQDYLLPHKGSAAYKAVAKFFNLQ